MKVADVNKLEWRQDKSFLAIERKMDGLIERENQGHARMVELHQIVSKAEGALVQSRAAMLLSEPSDEKQEDILQRLSSARQEMAEIQSDLEATKLARKKLEPTVEAVASEAKLRLAQLILAPYAETAESMRKLLERAAELNLVLHAIHDLAAAQDLKTVIYGNSVLRPLGLLAAWNFLSLRNGQPSQEFRYWTNHLDKIFGDN